MLDAINMTAVFTALDARKAEAQATLAKYSAKDQAEASRIASLYDRCDKTSVKHLCDTARILQEQFQPQPEQTMKTASWIIVNNQTGAAVFETFNPATAQAVNTAKYTAIPALQYLQQLNRKIKEAQK